jgi:competence protein ComEC
VLRWPAPKVAAVGAIAAATVYAALAGFSIPTQRALIMIAVAMGAVLLQRRVATTQLLAMALLLVLLYDPLAALSAGFWLSFTAVAVIVLFLNARQRKGIDWRNLGRLQWGIAIGLLPLLLLFFQQVSLVGPLANFFAVPLFGMLVVPFTLGGTIATMLLPDALTNWLFQFALWAVKLVWIVLEYLAGLRYSVWTQHSPGLWALAASIVGVFLLLAPRGWPARWLGAVWLLPLFTLKPAAPAPGAVWFTLLDVGQGLAAVVRTHSHILVYDTGPRFSTRFDAGRAVVVPYLRHQGVPRIDTLVVSHGDNDHIGGAASVLTDVAVGKIISSVPERLPMAEACIAGLQWRWDDVQFEILHPPIGSDLRGNNASCVLKVSGRHGSLLLPGDIEAKAERQLVEREREALASQVLVVPHQGSKTSSTRAFIKAVKPQFALFSSGYLNPFKHPHAQVKARYERHQARLYNSAVHGAVEVQLSEDGTEARAYRQHNRRYWFNQPSP